VRFGRQKGFLHASVTAFAIYGDVVFENLPHLNCYGIGRIASALRGLLRSLVLGLRKDEPMIGVEIADETEGEKHQNNAHAVAKST
jgi:hypothetical protein